MSGDTQLLGQWFGQTFWNDDDDTLLPALRRLIQQQPAKEGDDKAHQQILRRLSGALPRDEVTQHIQTFLNLIHNVYHDSSENGNDHAQTAAQTAPRSPMTAAFLDVIKCVAPHDDGLTLAVCVLRIWAGLRVIEKQAGRVVECILEANKSDALISMCKETTLVEYPSVVDGVLERLVAVSDMESAMELLERTSPRDTDNASDLIKRLQPAPLKLLLELYRRGRESASHLPAFQEELSAVRLERDTLHKQLVDERDSIRQEAFKEGFDAGAEEERKKWEAQKELIRQEVFNEGVDVGVTEERRKWEHAKHAQKEAGGEEVEECGVCEGNEGGAGAQHSIEGEPFEDNEDDVPQRGGEDVEAAELHDDANEEDGPQRGGEDDVIVVESDDEELLEANKPQTRLVTVDEVCQILRDNYRYPLTNRKDKHGNQRPLVASKKLAGWTAEAVTVADRWKSFLKYHPEMHDLNAVDSFVKDLMTKSRVPGKSWKAGTAKVYLSKALVLYRVLPQNKRKELIGSKDAYDEVVAKLTLARDECLETELGEMENQEYTEEEALIPEWPELYARAHRYYTKKSLPTRIENQHHFKSVRCLYIILMYFILHPPRRLELLKIVPKKYADEQSEIERRNGEEVTKKNYYDGDNITLEDYKTSSIYGTYGIKLNEEGLRMLNLLEDWAEQQKRPGVLFGSVHNLTNCMKEMSEAALGFPSISVDTLRKKYISHQINSNNLKWYRQRYNLSVQMGHAISTQQNVYGKRLGSESAGQKRGGDTNGTGPVRKRVRTGSNDGSTPEGSEGNLSGSQKGEDNESDDLSAGRAGSVQQDSDSDIQDKSIGRAPQKRKTQEQAEALRQLVQDYKASEEYLSEVREGLEPRIPWKELGEMRSDLFEGVSNRVLQRWGQKF